MTDLAERRRTGRRIVRVAIVDDHRLVIDGLSARLGAPDTGIDIVATASSWTGLLADPAFPADVVLLDLNLDDGVPVGPRIRAISAAGSRAVVMSRHTDAAAVYSVMQAGAMSFVAKTDGVDHLVQAIHAAAAGRRHLDPALASAVQGFAETGDPGLGSRERRALLLYSNGRSIREVAEEMGTTEETVKSYIKRARRKYRAVGVDLGTRALLRRHGLREGWITPD